MAVIAGQFRRPRVLFCAEAVTLAHVARPVALGSALAQAGYEVHLASHPRYDELLDDALPRRHYLESIPSEQFMDALSRGAPLYDEQTLSRYVDEDLLVIGEVKPEVIVGDMRLSLAVSAAIARIPYINISNAYWSPYCRTRFVVPELPFTRVLGPRLGQALFTLARPAVFAMHSLPLNRLRKRHGLPGFGLDLRRVYTQGDYSLYADPPDLFQMRPLPDHHRFLGPVDWAPECPEPPWWNEIPADKPVVYVTLGSSGDCHLLPTVLRALAAVDCTALVATAGAAIPESLPENIYCATYLPGGAGARRADLVISNGGSPTCHQALSRGTPVLGLAGNLDQYLNMTGVARAGAGQWLRSGTLTVPQLEAAIKSLLGEPRYGDAAAALARRWRDYDPAATLVGVLREILGPVPEASLPVGLSAGMYT